MRVFCHFFFNLWDLIYFQDGVVNDLDSALSAASQASNLPLSLAIVGVGPADFSSMVRIYEMHRPP